MKKINIDGRLTHRWKPFTQKEKKEYEKIIEKHKKMVEKKKIKHTLKRKDSEYYLDGVLLTPEASQAIWNHSPDGFSHGYGGSGPSQLALAITLEITGKSDGYQQFKWDLIAGLPEGKDFEIEFD